MIKHAGMRLSSMRRMALAGGLRSSGPPDRLEGADPRVVHAAWGGFLEPRQHVGRADPARRNGRVVHGLHLVDEMQVPVRLPAEVVAA